MAMKDWGRSLKFDHPIGWIGVGVAVLLTVPAVRKLIRQATVNTAVGVMALGDRMKEWTKPTELQSPTIPHNEPVLENTMPANEGWQEQKNLQRPPFRRVIVGGLATALNAADDVIAGTKEVARRVKLAGENRAQSVEVGQIGQVDDHRQDRLSENLLPRLHSVTTSNAPQKTHLPPAFAVKNTQALLQFANDVKQIGAEFKPEYEHFIDLAEDQLRRSDSQLGTYH
ncbi:hypothetical protein [Sulfoacidibacillus thermotolerans]|uniref:Uncharacterized protein n=1 Tax=Sulfoacidibacillus thermotolerans TaxID=1765684 RepID=A0A2U3D8W8_SULT2|nr:hypothetical protein [Sulfoacidibacillus thermotolerans]PWI57715.1 hypothetical protein BM613_06935 [Sulfoacidibacillus thermotolerans]